MNLQAQIYREQVEKHMKAGQTCWRSHTASTSIINQIQFLQKDLDVIMVAPKGPGHTVRSPVCRGQGRAVASSP